MVIILVKNMQTPLLSKIKAEQAERARAFGKVGSRQKGTNP